MRWHFDPGHEWLEVTETAVKGYRPSKYSYYHPDSGTVFLESDCDYWGWLRKTEPPHVKVKELKHDDFKAFCKLNGIYRLDTWKGEELEWILDKIEGKEITSRWNKIL